MSHIKNDLIDYQNRQELLNCLSAEKQHITAAIEKFYTQHAQHEAGAIQALEEMVHAFDRVITAGDWTTSLFLRNVVKPLKNMRAQAWDLREKLLGNIAPTVIGAPVLAPGMVKVYISVFQHKAQSPKDWEGQLRSLPQYVLGRPIYREEAAVQQAIRAKLIQTTDAYVCVGVPETAIQTGEFHPTQKDKQGNILLQLVSGAVKSENILEFMYQDKRYYFIEGKLTEVSQNQEN